MVMMIIILLMIVTQHSCANDSNHANASDHDSNEANAVIMQMC